MKLQGCRISTVVSENVILDYLYSTILYYTIIQCYSGFKSEALAALGRLWATEAGAIVLEMGF